MLRGLDPVTTIKVIAFLEVNLMDEFHIFECKHCEILQSKRFTTDSLFPIYIYKTKKYLCSQVNLLCFLSLYKLCFFEVSQFRERLFCILIVTKNKIP